MNSGFPRSDALVFFGATGDLAYKKIFPALHAMACRGHLEFPVIGVAKSGWTLDQLRARARESVEKHGGGVNDQAFYYWRKDTGSRSDECKDLNQIDVDEIAEVNYLDDTAATVEVKFRDGSTKRYSGSEHPEIFDILNHWTPPTA